MSSRKSVHHPVSQSHSTSPAPSPADVITRAQHGKEELLQLQKDLVLGSGLAAVTRKHLAVWSRMPIAALTESLALYEKYGAKVGDFDAEAVRAAVEYEQAITPLLDAAKGFVRLLEDSIVQRRGGIGKQPYGLLLALRAAVRYGSDAQVQRDLDAFEKLLVKRRSSSSRKKKPVPSAPPPTATAQPGQPGPSPALPGAATNDNAAPKGNGATTPAVDVSVRAS